MKTTGAILCFTLAAALSLAACSSPGRHYVKDEIQETLEIEILANGSKMFVYRLRSPELPDPIMVARPGQTQQRPPMTGVNINHTTPERLEENAAYVVKQTGYCREGFFALDRSISRHHLWLKGECKESASDADRQRFGNRNTLPASHWQRD